MRREIAESLEKNRHEMEERLQLTKNFDLVERKLKVGDRMPASILWTAL